MKKVSIRVQSKFMRVLLSAAGPSKLVKTSNPALQKLQNRHDFDRVMSVLEGLGLITFVRSDRVKLMWYGITSEGVCYFEKRALARRDFWLKSILVPIIIAIITSLVTVYILPPLGERARLWLSSKQQPISQSQTTHAPTSAPSETIQMDPTPSIPTTTPAPSTAP